MSFLMSEFYFKLENRIFDQELLENYVAAEMNEILQHLCQVLTSLSFKVTMKNLLNFLLNS